MLYTSIEKLIQYEIVRETEFISISCIIPRIQDTTGDIIYIVLKGKIYGIITMGDIKRSLFDKERKVKIKRDFFRLLQKNQIAARKIFYQNTNINSIPIVDEKQHLLGQYSRSMHLALIPPPEKMNEKLWDVYSSFWKEHNKILLVKPCCHYKHKEEGYNLWKKYLQEMINRYNGSLMEIERKQISKYIFEADIIIFSDEDERRTIGVLLSYEGINYGANRTYTFYTLKESLKNTMRNYVTGKLVKDWLLNKYKELNVILMGIDKANPYVEEYNSLITEKFQRIGRNKTNILIEELKSSFHEENYEQMCNIDLPFIHQLEPLGNTYHVKDQSIPFFTYKNGERLTEEQPNTYERCIYMFGPCNIAGAYVEDKNTLSSCLQRKLNFTGIKCKVVNMGMCGPSSMADFHKIMSTELMSGDIIIWDSHDAVQVKPENSGCYIDIGEVFQTNHIPPEWVTDDMRHGNHKVNQILSNEIFNMILPIVKNNKKRRPIEIDTSFIGQDYIEQYFYEYDTSNFETIGSIVMNCNPFTLGHRYLIERALEIVEQLIIFVVEEDRSLFSFYERYNMVLNGVRDLQGVTVVPSGEYILSQSTFPEYFVKIADEDIQKNIENDITIFAERIAPRLGITHRFVGEEKDDPITNMYNEAMKRILPKYGIELVEIPRIEKKGKRIRATTVRECMEKGDLDRLLQYIPESTAKILFFENN